LYEEFCRVLGIKPKRTTPYRPQGNPTERVNRNIKQCLRAYTGLHKQWDRHLPEISFALRNAHHRSIGLSPAELTLGHTLRSPFDDVLLEKDSERLGSATEQDFVARIHEAVKLAEKALEKAHINQKEQYDAKRRQASFLTGDLVLRDKHHLSNKADGFAASLAKKRDGPFEIKKALGRNAYVLQDPTTKEEVGVYNIDQLTPYNKRQ